MKIEEIRAMPGTYIKDGFDIGDLYAFWDGDEPQEWTQDKRYFAHMGHCLFTVGNKNLTLIQFVNGFEKAVKSREILAPEEGA